MWMRIAGSLVAAVALACAAGCPATGGGGGTSGATELVGVWSGEITCSYREALNDGEFGNPQNSTFNLTITINANGRPERVRVQGYSNTPDALLALARIGDQETVQSQAGNVNVTQDIIVSRATYRESSIRLDLDITHNGTGGNLTQEGTGTQVIEISLNDDGTLRYETKTEYEVDLLAGAISFGSRTEEVCTGTLTKSS